MSCTRCDSSAMRHWRSASLSWCLLMASLSCSAVALAHVLGEGDVIGQARVHAGHLLPIARHEFLAEGPLRIAGHFAAQLPEMGRVERVEVLDLVLLEGLADRLEELLAVFLDQRLEERHAEHFAFAFVDARGKILVHVVAEADGRAGTTGRRAFS